MPRGISPPNLKALNLVFRARSWPRSWNQPWMASSQTSSSQSPSLAQQKPDFLAFGPSPNVAFCDNRRPLAAFVVSDDSLQGQTCQRYCGGFDPLHTRESLLAPPPNLSVAVDSLCRFAQTTQCALIVLDVVIWHWVRGSALLIDAGCVPHLMLGARAPVRCG